MNPWRWTSERGQGIWRHGAVWFRPLLAAVPWITLLVLVEMLHIVGGTLASAEGVLFDLPDGSGMEEGEPASLVALAMSMPNETLVFFDDARYAMGDDASVSAFGDHLEERAERAEHRTLLVLADRRVPAGELMKIAGVAKRSGVARILFAEKREGRNEE